MSYCSLRMSIPCAPPEMKCRYPAESDFPYRSSRFRSPARANDLDAVRAYGQNILFIAVRHHRHHAHRISSLRKMELTAQNRASVLAVDGQRLWLRRLDAARRTGDGGNQPVPGHAVQIAGDRGGGLKPNAPADFPDGRAEAVRSAEFPDKLRNLLRFAVTDSLRYALTSSQTAHSTNQRPTCGEPVSGLCSKNSSRS